jgi:hypothetical protein
MRTLRVSVGIVGSVALLVTGLVVTRPQVALAQSDPHLGTWVLNVGKSKYTPGPTPKEQTSVYSATATSTATSTVATKGTKSRSGIDSTTLEAIRRIAQHRALRELSCV